MKESPFPSENVVFIKLLKYCLILGLFILTTHEGWAVDDPNTSYKWEFSMLEIHLQSQENMEFVLSDFDSKRRAFPAIGHLLTLEYHLGHAFHLGVSLVVPTREELIKDDAGNQTFFNFSKSLLSGIDFCLWQFEINTRDHIELRPFAVIATPLSARAVAYLIPTAGMRVRISLGSGAGFIIGVGYGGNFDEGTFFNNFGVSHRM